MILAGDEVLRTQGGNNNAYDQDNDVSWFDWRLTEKNRDMLRFVRELIALRRRHPALRRGRFLTGRAAPGDTLPDVEWHGQRLRQPPWHDRAARLLAFTLAGSAPGQAPLHVVLNMSDAAREVELPALDGYEWRRAVDTSCGSPEDILPQEEQHQRLAGVLAAAPRSVVVLEARRL
jgi:glycogen operon protein